MYTLFFTATVPMDTMNISLPVLKELGDTKDSNKHTAEEEGDVRLMLFPSQIQKLTGLLSLLAHLRDLVQRLIRISSQRSPAASFDWKSQLLYTFGEESRSVTISVSAAHALD